MLPLDILYLLIDLMIDQNVNEREMLWIIMLEVNSDLVSCDCLAERLGVW